MARDDFSRDADFLQDLWDKRLEGLPAPQIDWNGPIRHEHVEYLLNRYPFLQLISIEPAFPEEIIPQFVTADSGWVIHDYGDAMSTSPGAHMYGPGNPELLDIDQSDEGGTGIGTIVQQLFETAYKMINMAMEKGWPGAEIVQGTKSMQWAAWMAATDLEYRLEGYEANKEDHAKRERILRLRQQGIITPAPNAGRRR